jgi:DNA polymerase III subunit delta'
MCKHCRKFNSGGHPDFIRIDPEGQVTKIVQIRELRQILAMKPFEAKLRVVVISKAHTLNQEASNALLKVLEEPPYRTILILITSQISDLLSDHRVSMSAHKVPSHPGKSFGCRT